MPTFAALVCSEVDAAANVIRNVAIERPAALTSRMSAGITHLDSLIEDIMMYS